MHEGIIARIKEKDFTVGVIGLGYVGLPILLEFFKVGFRVIGFDIDESKIQQLRAGKSYIRHIPEEAVAQCIMGNPDGTVTSDFSQVSRCDAILICVPTPLNDHRDPELSYITTTCEKIAPYIPTGQLLVLESTTYPGTTEEVVVGLLETLSSKNAGTDFFVAYSPEREDPGNQEFSTAKIPKVVGGINPASLAIAQALYNEIICETIAVSDCRTAEATKLMENIFRCVNIALVNELKMVFAEMDINIWEVIHAARTKPFGFMPFYPGPGLGGHCIPIDPFYLTWKAKEYGISTKFIELAGEINTNMPAYVIRQTMLVLNRFQKSLNGSRIVLVGLSYKKNVDDVRESPTFVLWQELLKHGAEVDYLDPFCPVVTHTRDHPNLAGVKSVTIDDLSKGRYDVAIIATAHDAIDYSEIANRVTVVIDTRNACADAENVYRA